MKLPWMGLASLIIISLSSISYATDSNSQNDRGEDLVVSSSNGSFWVYPERLHDLRWYRSTDSAPFFIHPLYETRLKPNVDNRGVELGPEKPRGLYLKLNIQ